MASAFTSGENVFKLRMTLLRPAAVKQACFIFSGSHKKHFEFRGAWRFSPGFASENLQTKPSSRPTQKLGMMVRLDFTVLRKLVSGRDRNRHVAC